MTYFLIIQCVLFTEIFTEGTQEIMKRKGKDKNCVQNGLLSIIFMYPRTLEVLLVPFSVRN